MGKAATFGFSLILRSKEAERRAGQLVKKNRERYEIARDGRDLIFYYLPEGKAGSETQYNNGLKISNWVETGQGIEPR